MHCGYRKNMHAFNIRLINRNAENLLQGFAYLNAGKRKTRIKIF